MKEKISKRIVLLSMVAIIMVLLVGCRVEYSESNKIMTPAWKDDGSILYVKRYTKYKTTYNTLGEDCEIVADTFYLMKCDSNGENKEELFPIRGKVLSLNSSGEWIVVSTISDTGGMYVMKTDGSGLRLLGAGMYPDLSPDGSKIVYARKGEGIWIMNRDGSDDHQILVSGGYPSWSPDDTLIAYGSLKTHIVKLNGEEIKYYERYGFLDWGPKNSNSIIVGSFFDLGECIKINILTGESDTLNVRGITKCSPDGQFFIGYDGKYYVIDRNGTNKHYIEP